jgi:hypothetical protein
MAVAKKSLGSSKSPKPSAKTGTGKVAATKITPAKIHTTSVDASGGFQ